MTGVIPGLGPSLDATLRRLTFMVGFWEDICAVPRGADKPGPGQPLPDPRNTSYTWVQNLEHLEFNDGDDRKRSEDVTEKSLSQNKDFAKSRDDYVTVQPSFVSRVWEPINASKTVSDAASEANREEERHSMLTKRARTLATPAYDQCFQGF